MLTCPRLAGQQLPNAKFHCLSTGKLSKSTETLPISCWISACERTILSFPTNFCSAISRPHKDSHTEPMLSGNYYRLPNPRLKASKIPLEALLSHLFATKIMSLFLRLSQRHNPYHPVLFLSLHPPSR